MSDEWPVVSISPRLPWSELAASVLSFLLAIRHSPLVPGHSPRLGLNRFPPQPGDLVGVLVAATGEADDQGLAGSETAGLLEGLGQGVA